MLFLLFTQYARIYDAVAEYTCDLSPIDQFLAEFPVKTPCNCIERLKPAIRVDRNVIIWGNRS